jgi:hypothetical protein
MADLNAHEAGNGGQGQGRPTAQAVLFYSEPAQVTVEAKGGKVT